MAGDVHLNLGQVGHEGVFMHVLQYPLTWQQAGVLRPSALVQGLHELHTIMADGYDLY